MGVVKPCLQVPFHLWDFCGRQCCITGIIFTENTQLIGLLWIATDSVKIQTHHPGVKSFVFLSLETVSVS
jgi:hypothetical protein